ncbi:MULTISPECIES: DUF1422 family protein [unclassified Agarivorans]|uniref:DUF1422 family protein n=1 Tax=unclassified Agarivorans TaxID=2636026 RepID=UPI0010D40BAD|nr:MULTISPECIES: DUF1422 family protein [unclassified Agarivorans]MDO6687606.1 DUF1422 family protein [Agarivorans sp. 3_MG-2023]MDO6717061.1 DUF1422 family protein [Agarivorans sp. 2_MG-2023]MDO6765672.1 DUF1422 family protein [Agarivorans sp. 1_MG-2023]GDY27652.1 membrane protein [Agarivorans sp. Toyoura001]
MKVKKWLLLLAFIAGLCGNASLALLTVPELTFSVFPIIAFVLSIMQLYQLYMEKDLSEDSPLMGVAAFLLGALGYSAMLRAQFPDIGSNLVLLLICLFIGLWLMFKLGGFKR